MTDYRVVTKALRAQAGKWDELAAATQPPRDYAHSAVLGETAFLLADPLGLSQVLTPDNMVNALILKGAYEDIREMMAQLLDQAVVEFEQIGDALIRAAVDYEDADKLFRLNLDKIFSV